MMMAMVQNDEGDDDWDKTSFSELFDYVSSKIRNKVEGQKEQCRYACSYQKAKFGVRVGELSALKAEALLNVISCPIEDA